MPTTGRKVIRQDNPSSDVQRDQLREGVRLLDFIVVDDIRPWAEGLDCSFSVPIAR